MSARAGLDRDELAAWLMQVTQRIDHAVARGARARSELLAHLRAGLDGTTAGLARLAQLAVVSDCLRVAELAAQAGGAGGEALAALVDIAAPAYFMVLAAYDSFADGANTPDAVGQFLAIHHGDPGPFGGATTAWRGLALVRALEPHSHDAELGREVEAMLAHILDALIADLPEEAADAAHRHLRAVLGHDAPSAVDEEDEVTRGVTVVDDPRDAAFVRGDGPDVFASIAHGAQIHDRDPFDVESIHADAREVFRAEVVAAGTPAQHHRGHGRILLVLGDSGSGKTHLLRAFRALVHAQHLGYVGYLQMTSEVGDYARYVLRHVVDSLERPYAPPDAPAPALRYLSEGLISGGRVFDDDLARLREAEMSLDELTALVAGMVDQLLRHDDLRGLEPDLVQALLLVQRGDPALDRRVIRFLRCEPLTAHERRLLGGLAARDQPDDPMRTLRQLAAIAYELQLAAFVVLVDQVEDSVPDGRTVGRLQQAIDILRGIADAVPSAVIVIACLDDVYTALRDKLSRSVLDRLERDPPPVRLAGVRQRADIEAMLARRLAYLYESAGVVVREDDPLYPFTAEHITAVTTWRARDALAKLGEYHAACVAAGAIVAARPALVSVPAAPGRPSADLARLFNDTINDVAAPPSDDATILVLVAEALTGAAAEQGLALTFTEHDDQLTVEGKTLARRTLTICNGAANGHRLRDQLDALRAAAAGGEIVIALRAGSFEFTPRTKVASKVADLRAAGGRTVTLDERQLRTVIAVRTLTASHPAVFPAWRHRHRPLTHLDFVSAILDLDSIPRAPSVTNTQPLPQAKRPPGR